MNLQRFYPPKEHKNDIFRIVCVAQINQRKGQIDLVQAFKKLKLPHSELLLIGAMDLNYKRILKDYSYLFIHYPFIPNHRLLDLFHSSSLFVLPSIEDGFAIATLEAMASGLPVITTDNNGACDVIEDGKEGFIVPIHNPDLISDKILFLSNNKDIRLTMGHNASLKAKIFLG
ncbi:glycosyltransferase family 4 protein [Methylacidiphilum kamchatkense]|uniref:Glycosyl transferase family 1 n=1 Tax=Methylacidiphilum kamchatkense Kam1 TaxID=1202785 RepID=A0A516TNT6_9BACT|nr:glycosyltransferase family 4 protein [Methylacidiphilum kamchatkense]QDQ42890.1 glycosyl transferase family 1 [Methylacidiphilum kamchatkense Kam1]